MAEKPPERKTYGLPPLTIEEAARVLAIPQLALMQWIEDAVKPSDQERSMWTRKRRDLPEELIRLYITQHGGGEVAVLSPGKSPPGLLSVGPHETTRPRRRGTTLPSGKRE